MQTLLDTQTRLQDLHCAACDTPYSAFQLQRVSACCGQPLVAHYDLHEPLTRATGIERAENSMWRYRSLLPLLDDANRVSLGEGWTPILPLQRLASRYGLRDLRLKDEGLNPTGSFKARGLSMAISKAKELGVTGCIIPTAGNAGVAMAAYCARAGMRAVVAMPSHTPKAFKEECYWYGAEVHLVDGLINDCAARVRELNADNSLLDVSTLKEPYRLEGKKTMGYELAEQLNWTLPDVLLYPAGGGTGLIGIWKALREMQALGWLPADAKLPRMVAVQSANCCPLVETRAGHQTNCHSYVGQPTIANGLAVPRPLGEPLMLQVLDESNGLAVAITDEQMLEGMRELARLEGMFVAPEGAAVWMAARQLLETGWLRPEEQILLLNTGSGQKYLDNVEGHY
ncbi:threonine synthase [Hymenobacter taeanensis]|uniref:Threonine synthase n=1 Tax=Hymenobacter taeanensis TaxID=2735321 RepID=A0A6M6BK37_9BACT|nr:MULTISPECIES: threonine synthase [Hymenobacter]QJX47445.1 threonine synthase [Hymenobacter taeanensis]UOQ83073.1 threonine synthase [Hymenobacter sp. 5414T-23]